MYTAFFPHKSSSELSAATVLEIAGLEYQNILSQVILSFIENPTEIQINLKPRAL